MHTSAKPLSRFSEECSQRLLQQRPSPPHGLLRAVRVPSLNTARGVTDARTHLNSTSARSRSSSSESGGHEAPQRPALPPPPPPPLRAAAGGGGEEGERRRDTDDPARPEPGRAWVRRAHQQGGPPVHVGDDRGGRGVAAGQLQLRRAGLPVPVRGPARPVPRLRRPLQPVLEAGGGQAEEEEERLRRREGPEDARVQEGPRRVAHEAGGGGAGGGGDAGAGEGGEEEEGERGR